MAKNKRSLQARWQQTARNQIETTKQDWEAIKTAAQEDLTRALEVQRICDQEIENSNYLGRVVERFGTPGVILDDLTSSTGPYFGGTISIYAQRTRSLANEYLPRSEQKRIDHYHFVRETEHISDVTGSAVFAAAELEQHIQANTPDYVPVSRAHTGPQVKSFQNILTELRTLLQPLGQSSSKRSMARSVTCKREIRSP